jgi:hypothetical protein
VYGDNDFMAYQVEDATTGAEMQGPSSSVNQRAGRVPWNTSAAKSLAVLWFVCLGLYWALGALFRGVK